MQFSLERVIIEDLFNQDEAQNLKIYQNRECFAVNFGKFLLEILPGR